MKVNSAGTERKPTLKEAVNAKIRVLRDFCIVDDKNVGSIKAELMSAVKAEPDSDYELVLDRVARKLIFDKLG